MSAAITANETMDFTRSIHHSFHGDHFSFIIQEPTSPSGHCFRGRLALPVPIIPKDTSAELLVETVDKQTATIGYKLASTLNLKRGEVSREALRNAIVEHFLSTGDATAPLTAYLSGGGGLARGCKFRFPAPHFRAMLILVNK